MSNSVDTKFDDGIGAARLAFQAIMDSAIETLQKQANSARALLQVSVGGIESLQSVGEMTNLEAARQIQSATIMAQDLVRMRVDDMREKITNASGLLAASIAEASDDWMTAVTQPKTN